MIEATLTENTLDVKGHAGYDKPGKDIVCAAVSILIFTFCEVNKGRLEIETYNADEIAVRFEETVDTSYIKTGFSFLINEYPNNVKFSMSTE
ncbi:MAG: ribosomal-processing cysteine protease Prp [Eubacterium sp.]|jgi:uncharacterized protein YsxB (DUF464 family)